MNADELGLLVPQIAAADTMLLLEPDHVDAFLAQLTTDGLAILPIDDLDLDPALKPQQNHTDNHYSGHTYGDTGSSGSSGYTGSGFGGSGAGGGFDTHPGFEDSDPSKPADGTPGDDLTHNQDCTSVAGAADQIRDAIEATKVSQEGLNTSAARSEYATVIVRKPSGNFGALNNAIYTDQSPITVDLIDNIPNDISHGFGLIHNHPASPGDGYLEHLANAYPSSTDWQGLENLAARVADASRVSLWIINFYGALREIKLSDQAKYEALTADQRNDPKNLPAPSEVQGCSGG